MATHHDDRTKGALRAYAILLLASICAGGMVAYATPAAEADTVLTSTVISVCGNGIVEPSEVCDDGAGNNLGAYGSTTAQRHCSPDCQSFGPYCGDGVLQVRFNEQCDNGALNGGSGLCSLTCTSLPAVPPATPPQVLGSTPNIPGASPGVIPSVTQTQVVLRGKAFPNADINILLDGKPSAIVHSDSNANFLYNLNGATPGIATYSFWAKDSTGVTSLTTSVVFDVVQSALTSVNNIFIPPTLSVSSKQIAPGDPLNLFGESVPTAQVITNIDKDTSNALVSTADASGKWALQLDTGSLPAGAHSAKVSFVISTTSKSGPGKSVSFFIGNQLPAGSGNPDINGDGKVNLVDFSIFLLGWGTSNAGDDFNKDGTVNLADFSILLFNWTG